MLSLGARRQWSLSVELGDTPPKPLASQAVQASVKPFAGGVPSVAQQLLRKLLQRTHRLNAGAMVFARRPTSASNLMQRSSSTALCLHDSAQGLLQNGPSQTTQTNSLLSDRPSWGHAATLGHAFVPAGAGERCRHGCGPRALPTQFTRSVTTQNGGTFTIGPGGATGIANADNRQPAAPDQQA